jgi:ferrous iron transport protein A
MIYRNGTNQQVSVLFINLKPMNIPLTELPIRQVGIIKNINTDKLTEERLHSFGLVSSVKIIPVRTSPLGCPRIYKSLNSLIAIRNDDAKLIEVEYNG